MPSIFRRRARGIARIELALILAFMAFLLPVIFSIGRLFYVYAVLKQTATAAAASLAAVPPGEWAGSAAFNSPMKLRALQLIEQSLLDANVAPAIPLLEYDFDCNGNLLCGGDRQDTVTVTVGVAIPNGYNIMTELGMSSNMTIQTSVTVPYNH